MCGIAGFLNRRGFDAASASALAKAMGVEISHRGPDEASEWVDGETGIALAHRRLSIVELSAAGSQPMVSLSGRYIIVYNGEIYNHLELRAKLRDGGYTGVWRGHSDTETLLAAIEVWGLTSALTESVGMFAIALWDRVERNLYLARDRLGEKPLYYGWQGTGDKRTLLFGSELKALVRHPAFSGQIDRTSLSRFLRHGYVPAPSSIFFGIDKLRPGVIATFSPDRSEPVLSAYWSPSKIIQEGQLNPLEISPDAAVDHLESLLRRAVAQQMVADVPLGAFLSGGVDSSTVVALMQAQSSRAVRTFSIGFEETGFNEAEYAKAVAHHLGTDHTELYVDASMALNVVPHLARMYDEPFADSSQIPTHLVCHLARRHVTVSLSGDGGDELFGGYTRYVMTQRLWTTLNRLPRPLRILVGKVLRAVPLSAWNSIGGLVPGMSESPSGFSRSGEKIHKGALAMQADGLDSLYLELISQFSQPSSLMSPVPIDSSALDLVEASIIQYQLPDVERMMALDLVTYLPDDILVKVDRAAMAVSLETRVPLLDHRVVEFAWKMPVSLKIRDGLSKWALRQVLYRYVPRTLIDRPKMGFGIPIQHWLRGALRDWAEDLLSHSSLLASGSLNPDPIRRLWAEHLSGKADRQAILWNVLMFQAWHQEFAKSH
jgi:asparagine synthase (glutamine-hydrolysing)